MVPINDLFHDAVAGSQWTNRDHANRLIQMHEKIGDGAAPSRLGHDIVKILSAKNTPQQLVDVKRHGVTCAVCSSATFVLVLDTLLQLCRNRDLIPLQGKKSTLHHRTTPAPPYRGWCRWCSVANAPLAAPCNTTPCRGGASLEICGFRCCHGVNFAPP